MSELRVSLVQLAATTDRAANLEALATQLSRAARDAPDLVLLPEGCTYRGPFDPRVVERHDGPTYTLVREFARSNGAAVVIGGIWCETESGIANRSTFVAPSGDSVAHYDKTHLFRLSAPGLEEDEGTHTRPGDRLVTVRYRGFTLGMTICFDLRFPGLYRALARQGCDALLVPSNFAVLTGRDHWTTLLRARAIENGCYVLAPAQVGPDGNGFEAFGRSLAVDPWGVVLGCIADGPGVATVTLQRARIAAVRRSLDMTAAERPELYASPVEAHHA